MVHPVLRLGQEERRRSLEHLVGDPGCGHPERPYHHRLVLPAPRMCAGLAEISPSYAAVCRIALSSPRRGRAGSACRGQVRVPGPDHGGGEID